MKPRNTKISIWFVLFNAACRAASFTTEISMPSRLFKHCAVRALVLPMVLSTVVAFSPPAAAQDSAGNRPAASQTAHPFKISGSDLSALTTPDVQTDTTDGHIYKNHVMGVSQDKHYKSGLFSAERGESGNIDSYPVGEFMYFLKGGITLTSTDGTVLEVRTGEAVYVPKGWKGAYNAKIGFTKFYVVYDPDKAAE
jgi:ethanolamine utilization protein EutQ